jgi:hypothetical protein
MIDYVKKIDYEFECEALADFKYGISSLITNCESER